MNTTAALAGIALIGTIATAITGLTVSQLESTDRVEPEIGNENMYKLDNQLVVELVNRGEPINTSRLKLLYNYHGITYNHSKLKDEMQRKKNCLPANTTWNKGQRIECHTGIKFPPANNELDLMLKYSESYIWTETCRPSTTSAIGC